MEPEGVAVSSASPGAPHGTLVDTRAASPANDDGWPVVAPLAVRTGAVGVPRWCGLADELGWVDTFDATYDALARMHADSWITLDSRLAYAVKDLVVVGCIEALP